MWSTSTFIDVTVVLFASKKAVSHSTQCQKLINIHLSSVPAVVFAGKESRPNAGWNLHTFLLNFDPDLAWWKRNRTNCCISTHFTHSNVTLEYRPAIPSIGVVFSYINFFVAFKAQENVYLHLIMCRAAVLNIQSHANYVRAAISSDSHWILIFSAPCTKIIVVGQVKDD